MEFVLLDWNETVFANAISEHLLLPRQLAFYVSGHIILCQRMALYQKKKKTWWYLHERLYDVKSNISKNLSKWFHFKSIIMKLPVGLLWDEVMVTLQTFSKPEQRLKNGDLGFKMSFEQTGNFLQFPGEAGKHDDLFSIRTSVPA